MAILQSMWLSGGKKKLGGTVIYQAMGQTRQRELAASVSNPRTLSQMSQRVRWSNLVNLYRANRSWLKYAFETKTRQQSDYNKFMSLNVTNSPIFLPKQIAAGGGCIVAPYVITQGSLPSIEVVQTQTGWATNLYIADSQSLVNTTQVATVSRWLLDNNPGIQEGDQLSLVMMTQSSSPTTGVPFVIVRKYEVIIDTSDTRRFFSFMPSDYIGATESGERDNLCVKNIGQVGGFVLVLSRTIGGKTYVSTQEIVVANNSPLISAFSGDEALQSAIDSYGRSEEPFLTTTTAELNNQAFVPNSIVQVRVDGDDWTPGLPVFPIGDLGEVGIEIHFSKAIGHNITNGRLHLTLADQHPIIEFGDSGVATGNVFEGELGENLTEYAGYAASYLEITIDGVTYTCSWPVPNEATIGGLE